LSSHVKLHVLVADPPADDGFLHLLPFMGFHYFLNFIFTLGVFDALVCPHQKGPFEMSEVISEIKPSQLDQGLLLVRFLLKPIEVSFAPLEIEMSQFFPLHNHLSRL
jgi:hypothetical protein